jgi:hypothetical protein
MSLSKRSREFELNGLRGAAQARMRVLGKKILRKYGYPRDPQNAAVQTVRFAPLLHPCCLGQFFKGIRTSGDGLHRSWSERCRAPSSTSAQTAGLVAHLNRAKLSCRSRAGYNALGSSSEQLGVFRTTFRSWSGRLGDTFEAPFGA